LNTDKQNRQDRVKASGKDSIAKSFVLLSCFVFYPVDPVHPCENSLSMDKQNRQDRLKASGKDSIAKSFVLLSCFVLYPVDPVHPC
jgi:nitrate reductase NapE component